MKDLKTIKFLLPRYPFSGGEKKKTWKTGDPISEKGTENFKVT